MKICDCLPPNSDNAIPAGWSTRSSASEWLEIIPMQPDGALLDFLSDFAEKNALNRATP
jgi:hypothetical protein